MKIGDKARVRLEYLGNDKYLNQSGNIVRFYECSCMCVHVVFDNENVIADFGFYPFELELV